ncbi:hypothetical protein ABMA27_012903 [Loxostege sticticalis]|uniref:Uncharacterized protein n=1 Tax=Loxostege sticticalis TaxID=481309 RepID=A0ABR3H080_LOXSC
MMYQTMLIISTLSFVCAQKGLIEGDKCVDPNGTEGTCVGIKDCGLAGEIIKNRINSTICSFNATYPIICCPKAETKVNTQEGSAPHTPRRPDMKIGKIAFHKCIEYQEQIKYPCVVVPTLLQKVYARRDACKDPPSLVVGSEGVDASRGQFPHMALLGYVSEESDLEWLCGGTIISERFILTAGHCTEHRTLGPVAVARLGILKRSDPEKVVRDYGIKRAIQHPEYKPPSKYNDIALLETDKKIVFLNKHIVPACLDVGDEEGDAEIASATGWGALGDGKEAAEVLQIMEIARFSTEECSKHYGPYRLLKTGFDNSTQICYGHRQIPRDTCRGDSGGPLQVDFRSVECMQKVIGVTSFGKACGQTGQPGVYTRVRPYVPWIEGLVWPGEDYVFST